MRPDIILIAARARNNVIGIEGQLPWHLPDDLKRFKRLTTGHPIIMGRKTFESIGKPLPGRHNIVVTRNQNWHAEGVTVVHSLAEAVAVAGLKPETRAEKIFVIGGGDIYAQALPFATHLELTDVDSEIPGDAVFPEFDINEWTQTARQHVPSDGPSYDWVSYVRRPQGAPQ